MSVVPDKLAALAAPLGTRGALADVLVGICSALGADIELVDTVNDEATCPTTSLVTNAQATQAAKRLGLDQLGDAQTPIVMVLVDGLGWQMLRERAGHTPNLRRLLADSDIYILRALHHGGGVNYFGYRRLSRCPRHGGLCGA